jgi:hypothetical protein
VSEQKVVMRYNRRERFMQFLRHLLRLPSDQQWVIVTTTINVNLLRDSEDTAVLVAQRSAERTLREFARKLRMLPQ